MNIHDAAEQNDCAAIRAILDENPALVADRNELGDFPLHTACWMKNLDAAKLLIERGALVNAPGDLDRTPLHCAVNDSGPECIPIVKLLLESGADPTRNANAIGMSVIAYARQEQWEGFAETKRLLETASDSPDLYVALLDNDFDLAVRILDGADRPNDVRLREIREHARLHPGHHFADLPDAGLPETLAADRTRFVKLIDTYLNPDGG